MTLEDDKKLWEEEVLGAAIKRFPERKQEFHTLSGIPLPEILIPTDPDPDYPEQLGFPGEYPFTRGVQPTMYRGRFWTMRQYAGYATAEESNQRYRYLLEQGQTGLSVAFDLPTQIGYDADDPMAVGEVGKVGVSISSLEDMETLFDEIPLDKVSTSMTINAPAAILLAMYIAVAKQQGVETRKLRGTIQNDILKEYIARGTYIFPPAPSMRLITDIFRYCQAEVPALEHDQHLRLPHPRSRLHRRAGSGLHPGERHRLRAGGHRRRAGGGRVSPRSSPSSSMPTTISWKKWPSSAPRGACGPGSCASASAPRSPRSWMLRFHTQTAGSTLTAQQPENNVVRVTLQALAAVLGGTQSLHTNSMDEALWLPTEKSVRVALRTQQIIAYESGVADTIDPLAGSYLVEYLTDEIERRAIEYIQQDRRDGRRAGGDRERLHAG